MEKRGKGVDEMKKILCIIVISAFLVTVTGCQSQEEYNDYHDSTRPLNLMDSYNYENLETEWFTSNKVSASIKFSGIDTLWELDCQKNDTITLNYQSTMDNGDFKVLLITSEEKIEQILENTEKGVFEYKIPAGKNYIRIVGSQSEGRFSLDYKVGKQTKIVRNDIMEDYPGSLMKNFF